MSLIQVKHAMARVTSYDRGDILLIKNKLFRGNCLNEKR